jgi:hypothetical protein
LGIGLPDGQVRPALVTAQSDAQLTPALVTTQPGLPGQIRPALVRMQCGLVDAGLVVEDGGDVVVEGGDDVVEGGDDVVDETAGVVGALGVVDAPMLVAAGLGVDAVVVSVAVPASAAGDVTSTVARTAIRAMNPRACTCWFLIILASNAIAADHSA